MEVSTALSLVRTAKSKLFFLCISLVIPLAYLVLADYIQIDLADEGYLWNNTLATVDGMVPVRDIASYDPFRYYFCAFFVLLFGRGVFAIRMAMAVVQAVAIFSTLNFLDRYAQNKYCKPLLILLAIGILMWFAPYHKSIDIAMPIFSISMLAYLLSSEKRHRFLHVGIFVGFSAFIGKNHGAYNLLIFGVAILFLWITTERTHLLKKALAFVIGIVIGYLPMLGMLAFIPGLFTKYMNSIFGIVVNQSTNIKLPIPWPWTLDFSQGLSSANISMLLVGLFFMVVPIIYVTALIWFVYKKRKGQAANVGIFAAALVGLVYVHYAFSRADVGHVAHSVMPAIILFCLWAATCKKQVVIQWTIIILIALYSFLTIGQTNRLYNYYKGVFPYPIEIGRDQETVFVDKVTYDVVTAVQEIKEKYDIKDGEVLFLPHSPGMYPVMDMHSPTYNTYFLHQASAEQQETMIQDMKRNHTKYVIYDVNTLVDGVREDLAFYNTYPMVYDYIINNYAVHESVLPEGYKLFILNGQN
jgi:hypothetical protein